MRNLLLRRILQSHRACLLYTFGVAGVLVSMSFGQPARHSAKFEGMADQQAASSTNKQERSALEVTLKADRKTYNLRDQITIEVLLTNRSQSPLYLYAELDWGASASLSLWLKDAASGKDVPQNFIADALTPPPDSKDAFIKVLPNHVYGVLLTSKLADFSVQKKGTYELVAEYHSPIPSSMGFGLPIWSRERGAVSSNRVTITVGD